MAIKIHSGKLAMKAPGPLDAVLAQQMAANQIRPLSIEYQQAVMVYAMPFARFPDGTEHRDPFDRLIVSQALSEGLTLVSADTVLDGYGVTRAW